MRTIYLDEAGIGAGTQEPIVVVAGVVVNPDLHWRRLEDRFAALKEQFVPEGQREGFVFHAKDVWHGGGAFGRNTWEGDRRDVISALCQTIVEFELPIVYGKCDRGWAAKAIEEPEDSKDVVRTAFMASLVECLVSADKWMRACCAEEVATIIIEDNHELRRYAKHVHRRIKDGTLPSRLTYDIPSPPFARLIDAPAFMQKHESPPLQLADLCAFLIKRWMSPDPKVSGSVTTYCYELFPSIYEVLEGLALPEARASLGWAPP